MNTLTEPELGIMQVLWEADGAVPRAYIQKQLSHIGWKTNTFNTYLSRLQEKKFITSEVRGQAYYYLPMITLEQYQEKESRSMLSRLFGGSLKNFVLSVSNTDAVSDQDFDELQDLLNQLKGGKQHDE